MAYRCVLTAILQPRRTILGAVLAGLTLSHVAMAQMGPLPGLPQSLLGRPNGIAQLDAAGGVTSIPVLPKGSTVSRTLGAKLGEQPSLLDFGAKCDGITDDSAAVQAASAAGVQVGIPLSLICNAPAISQAGVSGLFVGPGQIKTSDGNLRGPIVSQLTAAPRSTGQTGVLSGFNGDLSHMPRLAVEHRVGGAATLGQSLNSYVVKPEASADLIDSFNTSGYNAPPGTGTGRTGLAVRMTNLSQYGQGDHTANWVNCVVASSLPNATSFLQQPECSMLAGQLTGGMAGAYLQGLGDINLADGGFDVAGIGSTLVLNRSVPSVTSGANAFGTTWIGYYSLATGIVPVDAAFSAAGPHRVVLDAVDSTTTAAIAAAAGQRIYLNATQPNGVHFPSTIALGTEYIDYGQSNGIELVVGGKPVIAASAGVAQIAAHILSTGSAPTLAGCGTSTLDYGSTDNRGTISFAGTPTQCTLTFATSFAGTGMGHPACTFTAKGLDTYLFEYGDTSSSVIFGQHAGAALTGAVNYTCL